MNRAVRAGMAVAAVANLVLAGGYALQQPWALGTWPWELGRLSYLFLASMLAAIGAAAAWIAYSGETGSLPAGFLNLAVTLGGIALFAVTDERRPLGPDVAGYAVGVLALVNLALFWRTRRLPQPAAEPMPALVRGSYVAFAGVLLVVGVALVLRTPGVMPWPLDADTSVVIGWMFFGDAWYFAYAVVRPDWHSARAQLWSFLGYDLVLFGPLLLADVPPELRLNRFVYLAVLAYSGALAVYYLVVNPHTRGWGAVTPRRALAR